MRTPSETLLDARGLFDRLRETYRPDEISAIASLMIAGRLERIEQSLDVLIEAVRRQ